MQSDLPMKAMNLFGFSAAFSSGNARAILELPTMGSIFKAKGGLGHILSVFGPVDTSREAVGEAI